MLYKLWKKYEWLYGQMKKKSILKRYNQLHNIGKVYSRSIRKYFVSQENYNPDRRNLIMQILTCCYHFKRHGQEEVANV